MPNGARGSLAVGGGHARWAMAFCRRRPKCSVTVVNSSQAVRAAERPLASTNLSGRITQHAGNSLADDPGTGYDLALLFSVIHGFSDAQNQALIKRGAQALIPGGLLVFVERLAGRAPLPTANATKVLLSASYFHLLGKHNWDYQAVRTGLLAAERVKVRRTNSPLLPGTSITLGTRRA